VSDAIIAVLQAQWAGGATDEHALTRPELDMGRAADCDLILDDPQVSGRHARITFQGHTALLMDLGSLNGTRLKGQPIPPRTPQPLAPGDEFQIGRFTFRLQAAGPHALPPLAERVRLDPQAGPGLAAFVEGKLFKFPLEKRVTTLGRGDENDIRLPSNFVSRQHAQIMQRDGRWEILDAGGRNGLSIRGQRVAQHPLVDGDILTIGGPDVALQFRASLGFVPVTAPAAAHPLAIDLKGRDRITIGRAPDNELVLDHPQVSRVHAMIERMGTRYRIKDLKSANGVFVGEKRIEREAWLKEGDEIRIGGVTLKLREDGIQQYAAEGLRIDALRLNKWVSKEKNLLQDISLCIYPQEFVALVGMSGSGKSTLLDAINGFRPATHGRVDVNGVDLYQNFDMFRNEMGYVPQRDIVHQELTVYSALNYAAQLRMPTDTSPAERHKRIMEVLADLDLTERKDLPIHKLSGGQLKRVSIGVELLTKPRLFFLDEPTSGLDPGTEFEMMRLLRKLADQGRTIVLITHATKNVMMCDKVIFLARGGHMAYYGPPEEALPYFDQYRTPQERQQKDIEFDDIYMILGDEKRGKGKDWDQRFRQSIQYRDYVVSRLSGKTPTPAGAAEATGAHPPAPRSQAGTLRQFRILSARNLRIMMADRFGLGLMLALAPIIGLMDFMWGTDLFDLAKGDPNKIVTMLFMQGLISILVGAMASVREIVKEVDIYKRERAINLKLSSYILSKVWVGVTLSFYQALILVIFLYLFALRASPLDGGQYGQIFITMFLGTLSGYLMGLAISAGAPNQNVALLLVIVVLVPQFLFAGALLPLDLIPGGQYISSVASTRWAFEALVKASAMGEDIAKDPCWTWVVEEDKQPGDLTQEQKTAMGCACMGVRMFADCVFPGIRNPDSYTEEAQLALAAPQPSEPPKPTAYPSPTPYPTLTPLPTFTPLPTLTPLPTPSDPTKMSDYMDDAKEQGEKYRKLSVAQGEKYRTAREEQGDEYQDVRLQQGSEYEAQRSEQGDDYAAAMKAYGDEREQWQRDREKAISSAESKIQAVVDNFGRTFRGSVASRWLAMVVIMAVVFALVIFFQKRKDVI
jgi:ABC transport system ATP-binding/permease protein